MFKNNPSKKLSETGGKSPLGVPQIPYDYGVFSRYHSLPLARMVVLDYILFVLVLRVR
jgi:hypothetical protein